MRTLILITLLLISLTANIYILFRVKALEDDYSERNLQLSKAEIALIANKNLLLKYFEYNVKKHRPKSRWILKCGDQYLQAKETALILIDIWGDHPCKEYNDRVLEIAHDLILPLVNRFRDANVLIIHAPYTGGWSRTYYSPLREGMKLFEFSVDLGVNDESSRIKRILKEIGIKNIVYCGFSVDSCILEKPLGIKNMPEFRKIVIKETTLPGPWNDYGTMGDRRGKCLAYDEEFIRQGFSRVKRDLEEYNASLISLNDFQILDNTK